MSVTRKPTSQDTVLEKVFGAPLDELYAAAVAGTASPALHRIMELRSFLAVAEEQLARVRDRIHEATAPARQYELSAEELQWDLQWLQAALSGRQECVGALEEVLRTMPAPGARPQQGLPPPKISARATAAHPPAAQSLARARRP
ncbi:hypothetical protein [Streptomyces paromomycinus]|uniref:Uncharacterized protein n=1 Tax=Streptomyces paromomycinus TaxID=92743 RepID=A0A401VXN8_STREY|nr:hypothetical protein [Streptomyces paromomycinus]GCD41838.1 hypothetical protein GKJPGBOP_01495 [Streptomyces paromomycinus]